MKKNSGLYLALMVSWSILTVFLSSAIFKSLTDYIQDSQDRSFTVLILMFVLLLMNGLFIMYFWLNGTKDLIYVIWYYCFIKHKELLLNKKMGG